MPKYFSTQLSQPVKVPEVAIAQETKTASGTPQETEKKKKKRPEDRKNYGETASGDVYEDKGYNYNGGYDGTGNWG